MKRIVFILFVLPSFIENISCQVYEHKFYLNTEISVTPYQYAVIDQSNPIAIWEKELNLPDILSLYWQDKSKVTLKMDNYRPNDDQKRPVLVLIHGGAFLPGFGDYRNESMLELAYQFSQRGYSVFSIEYRLMNLLTPSFVKAGYVAAQDAKAALRYIAARHQDLHLDPSNIFVGGISAGGFTAINAAYLDDNDNIANRTQKLYEMYGCLECAGDYSQTTYKIKGVINIVGGVYDINQFNNNPNIPLINFHGDKDDIVPYGCGQPFEKYSTEYNLFISSLKLLAPDNKFLAEKLNEAALLPVCGSSVIDMSLRRQNKTSFLYTVPGGDHSLVLGQDKRLSRSGAMIVSEISKFLIQRL